MANKTVQKYRAKRSYNVHNKTSTYRILLQYNLIFIHVIATIPCLSSDPKYTSDIGAS